MFILGGSAQVDVAAVARQAVANGADLLGVAGGDGTQSLVAGIAAEHGLPFVVISAGTRNHFALIVQSPAYRGDKIGTTLDLLPDLLQSHRGARLAALVDGAPIEAPQALLVANNPYGPRTSPAWGAVSGWMAPCSAWWASRCADSGRRRRRGGDDVAARDLHSLARRAARLGATHFD